MLTFTVVPYWTESGNAVEIDNITNIALKFLSII